MVKERQMWLVSVSVSDSDAVRVMLIDSFRFN